jgi:CHAT domain-containing protein
VHLHVGADANEYVFKSLSSTSPEIIHIATHGFYIPREERISYRYYTETTSDLAMERSGLMLAGANDAWNGKLIPGIEDGILTASEIAELDLSRTNLVVMSACETGLGEITEDGIEGLQRAFKSAGVETLVMSLWKVDDKATEMLMEEFYKLLIKGYSKDDAFQSAKAKVRSKKSYSSPYYWASFIMLD